MCIHQIDDVTSHQHTIHFPLVEVNGEIVCFYASFTTFRPLTHSVHHQIVACDHEELRVSIIARHPGRISTDFGVKSGVICVLGLGM